MPQYTNTSCYELAVFDESELQPLKEKLISYYQEKDYTKETLCGTICLSIEGVNVRLSGTPDAVKDYQEFLHKVDSRLCEMEYKDSVSDEITLFKFLVRLKKEIISMGYVDEVKPAVDGRAPGVAPKVFKQWLDEKKDMVVLDTRNDYEVRLGTFKQAKDLNIKSFRSFPSAADQQLEDKKKPIVMFCTGGVRCEKASHYLLQQGFEDVYQLEGGILKYFEEVGDAHYDGNCYIFDQRVALDGKLEKASGISMCFPCRAPLTQSDMEHEAYVENVSCPHCKYGKTDFRSTTSTPP